MKFKNTFKIVEKPDGCSVVTELLGMGVGSYFGKSTGLTRAEAEALKAKIEEMIRKDDARIESTPRRRRTEESTAEPVGRH